jgi:hypothetical protein
MKMKRRNAGFYRKKTVKKKSGDGTPDDLIRKLKRISTTAPRANDYRERSLKIHGLICAKCAREFDEKDRHLLTVHHKDGNPNNNPPDGSNWENLCVYCHDDEHSRGLLANYLNDDE